MVSMPFPDAVRRTPPVQDRDLFLAYPDIDLQNLLDERQGNFLAHINGIGYPVTPI